MSNEKVWRAPLASPGKVRGPDPPGRLSLVSIYKMQGTPCVSQTEKAVEREQIPSNEQVLLTLV
jgi:hypothetical protein